MAVLVDGPDHAAFVLDADGGFSYVHDGTVIEADSFVYLATDGGLDSRPMTVVISD